MHEMFKRNSENPENSENSEILKKKKKNVPKNGLNKIDREK